MTIKKVVVIPLFVVINDIPCSGQDHFHLFGLVSRKCSPRESTNNWGSLIVSLLLWQMGQFRNWFHHLRDLRLYSEWMGCRSECFFSHTNSSVVFEEYTPYYVFSNLPTSSSLVTLCFVLVMVSTHYNHQQNFAGMTVIVPDLLGGHDGFKMHVLVPCTNLVATGSLLMLCITV